MPNFSYVARTNDGAIQRGQVTASNPAEAKEMLAKRGYQLLGIGQSRMDSRSLRTFFSSLSRNRRCSLYPAETELLLHQVAAMLSSGLELTTSLREIASHAPQHRVGRLCSRLAIAIEEGSSLSDALDQFTRFPPIVSQLCRVGETTGELSVTLLRAAEFLEKRRETISGLLTALAYPVVVAGAACSVAAYLVGWAIPKLAVFLHAMGRKLPAMTQSLVDLSSVVQKYGVLFAVVMLTTLAAVGLLCLWKPGRYQIDRWLIKLPLIGKLLVMAETQQLASALSLMLRSGVFLQDALVTTASLNRNQFLASEIQRLRQRISRGQGLAVAFRNAGFSPLLPSMVGVGEKTGDLPKALDHVANFYSAQVDTAIKQLTRLIEPVIIVVVGGVVAYVYIAFFVALLSAGGNFK